jgi:lambda family phage portal protein
LKPNFLDKVIGYFSPSAGADRMKNRAVMSAVSHYDAAGRGKRTASYKAPGGDANSAVRGGRRLRLVARDMQRNNAIARSAVSKLVDNIIGDGIIPTVETGTDAADKWMNDVLRAHFDTTRIDAAGRLDLYGLQRLAVDSMIVSGESFVRRRPRTLPDNLGLQLPLQVELLEPEYIDETDLTQLANGNRIMDGIQFNAIRRRTAYKIYTEHPEDQLTGFPESVWVSADNILHLYRMERPGQRRGISWLAPVITMMNDAYDYADAQLVRQKIAAMWVAFTRDTMEDIGQTDSDYPQITLTPGMFEHLPPGRDVTFSDPPKVEGYSDHMKAIQRMIAAALSITYEELSGDLESVNFSSARIGRVAMHRAISAVQWTIVIPSICQGMEPWLRAAFDANPSQRPPKEYSFKWTPPKFPLTDPSKEIPAMVAQMTARLTSRQRIIREMGYDPDVIYKEIAEDETFFPIVEPKTTEPPPKEEEEERNK